METNGGGTHDRWVSDATQDLCHCSDCVDEYHRALEKAFREDSRFTKEIKKMAYNKDVARLENCLSSILSKCHESSEDFCEEEEEDIMNFWSTQRSTTLLREFECPILEILKYPRLLLNRRVNDLFVLALNEMEAIDQQIEVLSKYPGVYLLLVHQDSMVSLKFVVTCARVCMCIKLYHSTSSEQTCMHTILMVKYGNGR